MPRTYPNQYTTSIPSGTTIIGTSSNHNAEIGTRKNTDTSNAATDFVNYNTKMGTNLVTNGNANENAN